MFSFVRLPVPVCAADAASLRAAVFSSPEARVGGEMAQVVVPERKRDRKPTAKSRKNLAKSTKNGRIFYIRPLKKSAASGYFAAKCL